MDEPYPDRRQNALRIAARLAEDADDRELAEFARGLRSGSYTVRELLTSSAYGELLRRGLTPMVETWDAMSESERQQAITEAEDAEQRIVEAFEAADEQPLDEQVSDSKSADAAQLTDWDDEDFSDKTWLV